MNGLFSDFPYSIYLASASPRRVELLTKTGISFKTLPSQFVEAQIPHERAQDYVVRNSVGKGLWVLQHHHEISKSSYLVISADTVVVLDNQVLEKPKDEADCAQMLRSLSNRWHEVYSGLCFHYKRFSDEVKVKTELFTSQVLFKKLNDREIEEYIKTKEPLDKSGSYAVQGQGSFMVKEVRGSVTNIVGLPLAQTVEWLEALNEL